MQIYRHRQIGYVALAGLGAGAAVAAIVAILVSVDGSVILSTIVVTLVLAMVLFGSLTVDVTPEQLQLSYGPGLIRKRFRIDDIVGARIVRNPWYYGWGIRLTPHGWLFNVSGFDAVELTLKDGRSYRIGTDEPRELLAAIHQATGLAGA